MAPSDTGKRLSHLPLRPNVWAKGRKGHTFYDLLLKPIGGRIINGAENTKMHTKDGPSEMMAMATRFRASAVRSAPPGVREISIGAKAPMTNKRASTFVRFSAPGACAVRERIGLKSRHEGTNPMTTIATPAREGGRVDARAAFPSVLAAAVAAGRRLGRQPGAVLLEDLTPEERCLQDFLYQVEPGGTVTHVMTGRTVSVYTLGGAD